jgi:hypothetical protein
MARTNAGLVRSICDFTDEDYDLGPFILTANELVTERCTKSGYTAVRLELIERWLAAHFACVNDPRTTEYQTGPVMEKTEFKVDLGFMNTRYGQQALLIDSAGNLAGMENLQKIELSAPKRITWLGSC